MTEQRWRDVGYECLVALAAGVCVASIFLGLVG